jgi:PAS domain S-box-containing protein
MAAIRVLLVDDRPPVGDLTATYLERNDDVRVRSVESADEGLDLLDAEEFDCVVSAYEVPECDGLQFLADVRDRDPDLPFLLFTGKGSEEIASEAISAGVTDYLQKGSGREQYEVLANRIRNAVAQYRAQREAHDARDRLDRLYGRITDAFYALDDDWRITYVNEQACEFLDRDPEDLAGRDIREAFPEGGGDEFYDAYTTALETQEPATFTAESVFRPGRWVEERVFPSEDGLSVFFRDVTERRRRDQTLDALHDATRRLMHAETEQEIAGVVSRVADTVLEFPGTGVRRYDADRETLVSVAIGGEEAADVNGRPPFDVTDSPHGRAYREGESVTVEVRNSSHDLGPFARTMYVPIHDWGVLSVGKHDDDHFSDANVRFAEILAGNARAALDRAERESQLRARERALESQNERLEEFAEVVSHDVRNPLNVAGGHLDLARETGDECHFERVAQAHDRIESLVDDLLELAREGQTVGRTEPVALAAVAERAWENVSTECGATLRVGEVGAVEADESRLLALLENLFRNSVEHGDPDVTVGISTREGGFAVSDDGPGVPESERDSVFENGYTTDDDGIGLGLAIVKGIADAHGWSVAVGRSEAGGAAFAFEVE